MTRRQAITNVVAKEQFQRGAASLVNFIGLAFDDHARFDFHSAGRNEFALNLYQANQAGIEWTAFLKVTKSRNVYAQLPGSRENAVTRRHFYCPAVDCYVEG
jgi:hypothetical protein